MDKADVVIMKLLGYTLSWAGLGTDIYGKLMLTVPYMLTCNA